MYNGIARKIEGGLLCLARNHKGWMFGALNGVALLSVALLISVLISACSKGGATPYSIDIDDDGVINIYDNCPSGQTGWKSDSLSDVDGDGCNSFEDVFPNDPSEGKDSDGDGVGDNADDLPYDSDETVDTDNDGVGDGKDQCPTGAANWVSNRYSDRDGDGCRDYDPDIYQDLVEDLFPNDPSENKDADGDGIGDNSDRCPDGSKNWTSNVTTDSDGDGCNKEDNAIKNRDSDDDGIPDHTDVDDDNDGVRDAEDVDDDGDGLIEIFDVAMLRNVTNNLDGSGYSTIDETNTDGCGGGIDLAGNTIVACNGYELEANMVLEKPSHPSKSNWESIGGALGSFSGIFEGNGFTISNITSYGRSEQSGFFRLISTTGKVRNLKLNGGTISADNNAGVLAGSIQGEVDNVSITKFRVGLGGFTGGSAGLFTGDNSGTIKNSQYYCHLCDIIPLVTGSSAGDKLGGIAGRNSGTIINTQLYCSNCYFLIYGSFGSDDVGGIVGLNEGGLIQDSQVYCYSCRPRNVYGDRQDDNVGGLVGANIGGIIRGSFYLGDVDGGQDNDTVGGLVGFNDSSGIIENSFSSNGIIGGDEGSDFLGGLVGRNSGIIRNSYSSNTIQGANGSDTVGGLVGINYHDSSLGSVISSYTLSTVDGGAGINIVGYLVGKNNRITGQLGVRVETFGIIEDSYYIIENDISGGEENGYGAGISDSKIRSIASADILLALGDSWSTNNWNFGDNGQYPSLLSYEEGPNPSNVTETIQLEGNVLCSQNGSYDDDNPTRLKCPVEYPTWRISN